MSWDILAIDLPAGMGAVAGDGWHIEINIGRDEECQSFMLHVRGGDGAVAAVAAILDAAEVQAVDPGSESGIFDPESALRSFRNWRGYRDAVSAALND